MILERSFIEMKTRIITAVVALLIFIPVLYVGGILLDIIAALLGMIAVRELFKMKGLVLGSYEGILALIGILALVLPPSRWFFFMPKTTTNFTLFYIVVLAFFIGTILSKYKLNIEQIAFPVLVTLYIGFGFQNLVAARSQGLVVLFYALLIVWSTDIGAYFIGKKYGKNHLAPSISPNKTIEGSLGGIISAVVVSFIYLLIFSAKTNFNHSLFTMLVFSIIFSVFGQIGDLVESSYKRFYHVKDSGNILPGHGGILDRFDSLLFVFPLMHILGLF